MVLDDYFRISQQVKQRINSKFKIQIQIQHLINEFDSGSHWTRNVGCLCRRRWRHLSRCDRVRLCLASHAGLISFKAYFLVSVESCSCFFYKINKFKCIQHRSSSCTRLTTRRCGRPTSIARAPPSGDKSVSWVGPISCCLNYFYFTFAKIHTQSRIALGNEQFDGAEITPMSLRKGTYMLRVVELRAQQSARMLSCARFRIRIAARSSAGCLCDQNYFFWNN